jgi:hypothetical protein
MVEEPTSAAPKPQLSAVDLSTADIGPPFKEVSDTPKASSVFVTGSAPNKATRKVVCEKEGCRVTFQSKKDLRRHTTTVHDQVYIQCQHCQKLLKGRDDNLKRHLKRYCKGAVL